MGKHAKYARHFKTEWTNEPWAKAWLKENKTLKSYNGNDPNEAYCVYCHTSLRAHYTDLKKHADTKMHKRNAETRVVKKHTVKQYFPPTTVSANQKITDLKLTMHILQHSSIRSVDHLGELLSNESVPGAAGSQFTNLKLHRTKCACLIKKVIGPAYLQEIVQNVSNKQYACIIDESTDVSVNKYLAVCIRYFNDNIIITDFLGLIEVERATAYDLYVSLVNFFNKIGLPLRNMLALGTDGGANLYGRNNSVYTLLKNDIPNLLLLKCICHSIHLCVSRASSTLPSCLDFLAHEVYNWFSNSSLRKVQYKRLYDLININEKRSFKNFIKLSATRWLARHNVLKRILDNWVELKTFFDMAGNTEKCYKARMIANILNDDKMKLYFKFLLPFLEDTNKLNLIFQSNDYDVGSAYQQYFLTVESLARRIIKPRFLDINVATSSKSISETDKVNILKKIAAAADNELSFLTVDDADLGNTFTTELENLKISKEDKLEIKKRCFDFVSKLFQEFISRMPSNIKIFSNIRFLNPVCCLNKQLDISFQSLQINEFILNTEDYNCIENQWRKLKLIDWQAEFVNDIPNNVLQFWLVVFNYRDGSGEQIFKELATVVLRLLCLPISNAAVERVFSIMNNVKTKVRNRIKLDTLEAIIRTKVFCFNRNICCKNFIPTDTMLTLFNSSIYSNSINNDVTEADDINVLFTVIDIAED